MRGGGAVSPPSRHQERELLPPGGSTANRTSTPPTSSSSEKKKKRTTAVGRLVLVVNLLAAAVGSSLLVPALMRRRAQTRAAPAGGSEMVVTSASTAAFEEEEDESAPAGGMAGGTTLRQGDLPGYTGWYRPSNTLAGHFSVAEASGVGGYGDGGGGGGAATIPGSNFTVTVECRGHPACNSGASLFYVRAYGPSILPGIVTYRGNGRYDISIPIFDEGTYQLEVVLTFSNPPEWNELPLLAEGDAATYEGYLLPGFPLEIAVASQSSSARTSERVLASPPGEKRKCSTSDLIEIGPTSAIERGRWLVNSKNTAQPFRSDPPPNRSSLLPIDGYKGGMNSLGFTADFVPASCDLLSQQELKDAFAAAQQAGLPFKPVHVLFIGDSNMRLQRLHFDRSILQGGNVFVTTEHINMSGGIIPKLNSTKTRLRTLREDDSSGSFVVIFNSGLHDINKLCASGRQKVQEQYLTSSSSNGSSPCFQRYRDSLGEFVDAVASFPSLLTVFQTTGAGWPKWGVVGGAWPPAKRQPLPLSPDAVEHLNEIAWDVVRRRNVPVVDYYWLSLPRPDNREVNRKNDITRHLVHPGLEVLDAVTRKLATLIIDALR